MQKPVQTRVRWIRSSNAKHHNLFEGKNDLSEAGLFALLNYFLA